MADAIIKKFPTLKVKAKAAVDRAVTNTKMAAKATVDELKTWRIGEWGSIASILGIGLYFYDKKKTKKP